MNRILIAKKEFHYYVSLYNFILTIFETFLKYIILNLNMNDIKENLLRAFP